MTDRAKLVVELLLQRWDWLPAIRGSVPTESGFVPGDGMAEEKSSSAISRERIVGEAEAKRLARKRMDGEIRRLELAEKHRRGEVDPSEKLAFEAARLALWREGSFEELEAALVRLGVFSPPWRAAVELMFGPDHLRQVGPGVTALAELGVEWVAGRMPELIRVPERPRPTVPGTGRWANVSARARRDREIERLHREERLNRQQIARRLGLDRSTVSRVLAPRSAAA